MDRAVLYNEVAFAVANHVYEKWYRKEDRIGLPAINTFDNMRTSSLQIAAGVLKSLKIVVPIDDIERRFVFTCSPSDFRLKIEENESLGCEYNTVVLSAIALAEYGPLSPGLLEMLIRLELCEPVEYKTKLIRLPTSDALYGRPEEVISVEVPDFKIIWTERRKHYDEIWKNWVLLLN